MDLDPQQTMILFFVTLGMMAFIVLYLGKKIFRIDRNQTMNNLHIRQLELENEKKVFTEKLQMRELTFKQIGRELHDNIQGPLMLSRLNLYSLRSISGPEKEEKINSSIDMLGQAMSDLSNIYLLLNTDWIKGLGFYHVLEKEIEKLRITGLFIVEADFSGEPVTMDADKEVFIFRIVQEAFNNIIKYSEAKKIAFSLVYDTDHAKLIISDDGKGFQYAESDKLKNGSGLQNIRERAAVLNANLQIDTAPGKGTSISLTIPYNVNHTLTYKN